MFGLDDLISRDTSVSGRVVCNSCRRRGGDQPRFIRVITWQNDPLLESLLSQASPGLSGNVNMKRKKGAFHTIWQHLDRKKKKNPPKIFSHRPDVLFMYFYSLMYSPALCR